MIFMFYMDFFIYLNPFFSLGYSVIMEDDASVSSSNSCFVVLFMLNAFINFPDVASNY